MNSDAPIIVNGQTVLPEWIDYNGHMNVAYYLLAFDRATDVLYQRLGLGVDYMQRTTHSTFTLECHITYLRELTEGDPLRFSIQMLDFDRKRVHFFSRMTHRDEGYAAATMEWLSIHVDLETRRSAEMNPDLVSRLTAVMAAHTALAHPPEVGRIMGIATGKAA